MSTQYLPPPAPPPAAPPDKRTQRLGPLEQYTRRRYMLFHLIFTVRLVTRCLNDRRVPVASKLLFTGVLGALLFALVVPEAGADLMLALLPVVGPVLDLFGIPFEGVVDWSFFVLVAGSLIRVFPHEVLAQHIQDLRGGLLSPPPS